MIKNIINNSIQTNTDCILCLALDVAEGLLKNGDSVRHVEDTIERICRAYGGVHVETFAIHSLILSSLRMEDGSYSSQIRRVYSNTNNMSALESFNSLSRRICSDTPDFDTAQLWLKETKAKKPYPVWLHILGQMLVAGSFAVLFGGSMRDGLAGCLLGLLMGLLSQIKTGNINALAKTLIMSFIAGLLSYATVLVGIGQNVDMIMIGGIMLLIPGLAFGNALRDLLCGDILTGLLKTVQSCLSAVLIACGFSGAMLIMANTGVQTGLPALNNGFILQLAMAIIGTMAFSVFFCVRPSCLWITAVGGGAVFSVYSLLEYLGAPVFFCAFGCAAIGAVFAEVCARIYKVPAIVFLTSAIISIVPGGALYYTMSSLVNGNQTLLLDKASQTMYISAGLAVGMLSVTILLTAIMSAKKKKN